MNDRQFRKSFANKKKFYANWLGNHLVFIFINTRTHTQTDQEEAKVDLFSKYRDIRLLDCPTLAPFTVPRSSYCCHNRVTTLLYLFFFDIMINYLIRSENVQLLFLFPILIFYNFPFRFFFSNFFFFVIFQGTFTSIKWKIIF